VKAVTWGPGADPWAAPATAEGGSAAGGQPDIPTAFHKMAWAREGRGLETGVCHTGAPLCLKGSLLK